MGRTKRKKEELDLDELYQELEDCDDLDYDADLEIDPEHLDVEWVNHSKTAMKYSKAAALYSKIAKAIEQKTKVLRSQLIKDANLHPDRCLGKGMKPTAPLVEAYYRDHPDHKKLKDQLIQAQYEADIMNSAMYNFKDKKVALENLGKLLGQEYFDGPDEPHDLAETVARVRKEKKEKTKEKIRRKLNKQKYKDEDD